MTEDSARKFRTSCASHALSQYKDTIRKCLELGITEKDKRYGHYVNTVNLAIKWMENDILDSYAINIAEEKHLFLCDAICEKTGRKWYPLAGFVE